MPRYAIITAGIVIILLMLSMWGYLFIFGAPEKVGEVFSNLQVISPSENIVRTIDTLQRNGGALLSLTNNPLEQLSTRAVAGFTFIDGQPNIVRYAERGTGHLFEIDLQNSFETQISLTTLPQTVAAVFSPNGTRVALTVYDNYTKKVSVGTLTQGTDSLTLTELPLNAENVSFKNNTELYYTRVENNQTVGYVLNLQSLVRTEVLRTALTDIQTVWGGGLSNIYLSPKPAQKLEGALYTISGTVLTPKTPAYLGLSSFTNGTHVLASYIENDVYVTDSHYNGSTYRQGVLMFPEKCVFSAQNTDGVWCAAPLQNNASYIENWHMGALISEDYFWYVNLTEQTATLVGDLPKLGGKTLDITSVAASSDNNFLLFTNKIDQTLWLYRITQ